MLAIYKDSLQSFVFLFLGVCRFVQFCLFCNAYVEKRYIKCLKPAQKQVRGRGRALRRNYFSAGVVRERGGRRKRCLLLGKSIRAP